MSSLFPEWKSSLPNQTIYSLTWCHHCECAIIVCNECKNGSCNGGSCKECHEDFLEFRKLPYIVELYLTPEEIKIYQKGLRIQSFIIDTLESGGTFIDWKKMKEEGNMSQNDEELFADKLV